MILYQEIEGLPDERAIKRIKSLYRSVFTEIAEEKFENRMNSAPGLFTVLALSGNEIVGFKIGFRIDSIKFYSWIGGVEKKCRKLGIAGEMMKRQHSWCRRNGFRLIRTKTKNSFREMLILNIKSGFNITEVYSDGQGQTKIVMEKELR